MNQMPDQEHADALTADTVPKTSRQLILFTGGGSAGHVTPNLALIPHCQQHGWSAVYVGSHHGIEKELVTAANISYYGISSGKLRRYLSWKNVIDPIKIAWGTCQAIYLCRRLKPNIIFSKGGFVSFPVVVAGWLSRIPVVAHEADLTPGLANRLSFPFIKKLCISLNAAKQYYRTPQKCLVTGTPLREQLFAGDKQRGKQFCGFTNDKPTLLITGGGLGAEKINVTLRDSLPRLLPELNIIHLCGRGKVDPDIQLPGYQQFEYVQQEMADLYACADCVVSRAGANSLYELIALQKPHIVIPLGTAGSRGDQIENANYFQQLGLSRVLWESDLSAESLVNEIKQTLLDQTAIQAKLAAFALPASRDLIYDVIRQFAKP